MGGHLNTAQQSKMIQDAEERGATGERERICALLEESLSTLGSSGDAGVILMRKIHGSDAAPKREASE